MTLVFLVPIRHPEDCRDPQEQQSTLTNLFASMQAQTNPDWRAIVVANHGQKLPALPDRVQAVHVDFPPNAGLRDARDAQDFYDLIRLDKGRRLMRGLTEVSAEDHVMVADDDDLLSSRLVDYVADRRAAGETRGYVIDKGYTWQTGSDTLQELDGFHRRCGTSLICPPAYYDAFGATGDRVAQAAIAELGSHRIVFDKMERTGDAAFLPVPFRAAIYRISHANASQVDLASVGRPGMMRRTLRRLLARSGLRPVVHRALGRPAQQPTRPVPITPALRAEFFGGTA